MGLEANNPDRWIPMMIDQIVEIDKHVFERQVGISIHITLD